MTHTPGPWMLMGEDAGADGVPYLEISAGHCPSPEYKQVCFVQSTPDEDCEEWELTDVDHANARLIAAAPELLEALQSFVDEVEGTYPFESLPAARAAISKAKGSP